MRPFQNIIVARHDFGVVTLSVRSYMGEELETPTECTSAKDVRNTLARMRNDYDAELASNARRLLSILKFSV